jgi:hypothetical protein
VLEEAQGPAGPQYPADLGERAVLVVDGAQDEEATAASWLASAAGSAPAVPLLTSTGTGAARAAVAARLRRRASGSTASTRVTAEG